MEGETVSSNTILEKIMTREELEQHFPYRADVSFNDIVPSEYQSRLQAIDAAFTIGYFEMGDIANECINNAPIVEKEKHRVITYDDVYNAVGFFCHRSARTVRYYAETSRFYPMEVRREFEELPFSHFVLARRYKDNWRDILEFSLENIYLNADQVAAFFRARAENAGEAEKETESGSAESEQQQPISQPARASRDDLLSILSGLSTATGRLVRVLESPQVAEDIKIRVETILDDISDVVADIKEDLSSAGESML